jgi:glycosyltransferase involved in cell wall biosynthesis
MDSDLDIVNIHDFAYRTGYFYKNRNSKAQIIWTENAAPYLYIPRGRFFADILGWAFQTFKEWSSKKYFRAIDKVAVLDMLNKKWSEDRGLKNVTIIRCGVDFDKFYAPVKDFSAKAKKRSVQLFALGALNAYRRYDIVVRAVKLLRDGGVNARALIICNNIWRADLDKKNLIQLVKELALEPFIDFRFAGVTEEDLRTAYRSSDFFVQAVYVTPPGNHGWGIVNFEGMAAGLPVILCRGATATEVLKDNENAFFMDPLAPEQIAEKVRRCIADPELYKKIAEAGQNVARVMTWESTLRKR